jgi:hypothetical protein
VLGLAWELLTRVRVRLWAKLLSIAALAIGGTGISPLLHFVASPSFPDFSSYESAVEALIYNSRLLGLFDSSVATGAWQAVFVETPRAVRLPIETFGYQCAIGGYHAVLAGFQLQFLALTIMAAIPRSSQTVRSRLEFVLGLSVPLALCSNAWVFPLQAFLVAAWTVWDRRNSGSGTFAILRPVPVPGCSSSFLFSPGSAAKPATCTSHSCHRKRTHRSRSFWSCGGRFWCWCLLSCSLGGEFRSPDSWRRFLLRFSSSANWSTPRDGLY